MNKRYVTIREVAADAKVGTATISRVLNEPWRVSAATRERVLASVQKLGYKPNFRARLLARGNSGMICFLLSNRPFVHSVHAGVLQGAAKQADLAGVQIVYAGCHYSQNTPPQEIEMPQILAARGFIDGVIVAGTNYPNILEALEWLDLPYVVFGSNMITKESTIIPNAVYVDGVDGGYQATKHLLSLGHTKIKYVGDVTQPWFKRRYEGYARAMLEAGIKVNPPKYSVKNGAVQMGHDAVKELCDSKEDFTALFLGDDMTALGAIRALTSKGLRVPEDISVVGFDDEEIAQITEPPLTTVRMPTEDIGAKCVNMMNEITKSGVLRQESVFLPVELIFRESTAPLAKEKNKIL